MSGGKQVPIERVVIDTNLLVRYLTGDDPQKAKAVDSLLDRAEKGELKILVPSIVIAELVWVLESFYELEAEKISDLIEAVLNTPGLDVTDSVLIRSALTLYKTRGIDFIDGWIIAFAGDRGVKSILTFDKKHFRNIEGIETVTPAVS